MNAATSTLRPALSTMFISNNRRINSCKLDESLANSQKEYSLPALEDPSSHLLSDRNFLGTDDNNHEMYGLTRAENWLFSAGVLAGLTMLGYICKWLLM